MAGRPPKPTELRILQGTFKKGRDDFRNLPKFDSDYDSDYDSYSPHNIYKNIIYNVPKDYYNFKIIFDNISKNVDQVAFANYCELYGQWVKATRLINERGLFKLTDTTETVSPVHATQLRISELLKKYADAFGITPASRSRIDIRPRKQGADKQSDSKFGKFA